LYPLQYKLGLHNNLTLRQYSKDLSSSNHFMNSLAHVFYKPCHAPHHEEHCSIFAKVSHFYVAEEQELSEHIENAFWVRHDEHMATDFPTDHSNSAQIDKLADIMPLSEQHMAAVKRRTVIAEIANSLPAANQTSMPSNEPLSSQPMTYVSKKNQQGIPTDNFYDKAQNQPQGDAPPALISPSSVVKFDDTQELLKVKF